MPIHYVGYLGLVPIMLGVKTLIGQFRSREDAPVDRAPVEFSVVVITSTLFANSADTMLVFSPLLADSETGMDYMIVVGYIAMATIWFLLALFFSRHAARLHPVSVAAQWLAPLIMIAVGFYILDNTLTDVVAGS